MDVLTKIPEGIYTEDNYDIEKAREALDASNYGMEPVKERILEFISVSQLKGEVKGKIIALSGPPGVGKTSIASSLADALGRKFVRISCGGTFDPGVFKGTLKTFVGSSPGKVIKALITAGTMNPVILIDELDKLGEGSQGDPSAVLLEILDPEQNNTFKDDFVGVPVDLSKVLFVCTANELQNISAPVLDRMEVIKVPGYTSNEKQIIANKYFLPKAIEGAGLA